jgi:type II secretion system protein G
MMRIFLAINMKNKRQKQGFTLIELLVVVAIIGLLSSVVMASLNSARVKARDAKRKVELKQITNALELYYNDYGRYPPWRPSSDCGGNRIDFAVSTCTEKNWLSTDPNFLNYISTVPKDPLNKTNMPPSPYEDHTPWWFANTYTYGVNDDGSKYDLLTNLENTSDPQRCELKLWKSEAVWASDTGCWSSATLDNVPDRAKQIYSPK